LVLDQSKVSDAIMAQVLGADGLLVRVVGYYYKLDVG